MNNPLSIGYWLANCGLDRIDASVLLNHVTGWDNVTQRVHPDYLISDDHLTILEKLKRRRLTGEPLAYIIEEQEFFSLPFKVNPHTLIPRPDTECLVEWLVDNVPKNTSVVDLGTGSGCIAIALAFNRPDLTIFASDIDPVAVDLAAENSKHLNTKVEFFVGSWLEAFPEELSFDVIVSNPPYIRPDDEHLKNLSFEPLSALTDNVDGLKSYRQILRQVSELPHRPGILAFEHGWDQKEAVQNLFIDYGFENPITYKDYGGNYRFTVSQQ